MENKKNKRIPIPFTTKLILVGEAAGMCEFPGCGKRLFEDWITKKRMNNTNFAHIIADSPDGPRGDKKLSKKLCSDICNLMLLCPDHHKYIDSPEGVKEFTVTKLRKIKQQHEERIRYMTSVCSAEPSTILIYVADINSKTCPIDYKQAESTIFPERYPARETPILISMKHPGEFEKDQDFWKDELKNLEYNFQLNIETPIKQGDIKHLSVFALAPMPLLVKLGTLLSDIKDVDTYQLHREPRTWKWQSAERKCIFKVERPDKHEGRKPVLIFSLSSNITKRAQSYYKPADISSWVITIDNPNNDYLRSKKQLSEFRKVVRSVLEDINKHSSEGPIDIYMAMSNACAVDFGRVWMSKADRHLVLHDYYDGKDNEIITI